MEEEILKVRMLGGFSMVYQEKTLVFDRNYISKSTQLLQILFLHLEKGIAKERLLEELYGRDDVENRNGSLNNTIFRLRKQLEAAGLPEGKYFYLKKGIYYWDSVIPVETDLSVFEKKLEESRKETDEEKKNGAFKRNLCSVYRRASSEYDRRKLGSGGKYSLPGSLFRSTGRTLHHSQGETLL